MAPYVNGHSGTYLYNQNQTALSGGTINASLGGLLVTAWGNQTVGIDIS